MKERILVMVLLAIVTVLSATGCSPTAATPEPAVTAAAPTPSGATAEGRLEPVRYAELALNANGSVSDLLVQKGDALEAGQVIAELQSPQAQTLEQAQSGAASRLASAYQAARDAQNHLDNFDVPAQYSNGTAAQAAQLALANLEAARAAFEPYKDTSRQSIRPTNPWHSPIAPRVVVDTGDYSGLAKEYKKQLDGAWVDYRKVVQWLDLQSALESAQAQLAQAQKDYDSLQDPSLAEDTAGARAALANAELRSPFAGTVTNLDLKLGEFAASGQPVVTVADFSSWVVKTTDLTEIDVVNIKEGQPVTLTLDAIPGTTFKGYVQSIAQNYAENQGDIVYEVTVLLTDTHPAMRWGMTAKLDFTN